MSDPTPQPSTTPDPVPGAITKTSEPTHSIAGIIAAVAVVVLIFLFLWWHAKSQKPVSAPTQTAEQIRQIFQVPTTTPQGSAAIPPPTNQGTTPANQNPPTVPDQSPRGPSPTGGQIPSTPTNPSSPPPAQTNSQPNLYQNPSLGFTLTMPPSWRAETSGTNIVAFFDISTGAQIGYIEVYNNSSNQTLNNLSQTLKNSPDVTSVTPATLNSQPALQFSTTTQFKNGIATVYNNRVYYLRGDLAKPDIVADFKFN